MFGAFYQLEIKDEVGKQVWSSFSNLKFNFKLELEIFMVMIFK